MKLKLFSILILIMIALSMQAQSPKSFTKVNDKVLMSNFEVSVNDYLEFVKSKNSSKELWYDKNVFTDTCVFGSQIKSKVVFEKYYSNDNTFSNFPIVGVSSAQAEEFCKWLTEKLNSQGIFKGKIKEVRLPTLNEFYSVLFHDTIKAVFNPYSDNHHKFERLNEMDINVFTNISTINISKTILNKGFNENLSGLVDGYVFMAPVNAYSGGCVNLIGNVSEFVYSDDRRESIIPVGNNFSGQIIYHGRLSDPEYFLYDNELLFDKNKWTATSAKIGFRFVVILN